MSLRVMHWADTIDSTHQGRMLDLIQLTEQESGMSKYMVRKGIRITLESLGCIVVVDRDDSGGMRDRIKQLESELAKIRAK